MGPLRDFHLSRLGVLILATASLAATTIILAGAGTRTDAQLAAEAALRSPLREVVDVESAPAPAASRPSSTSTHSVHIGPPASETSNSPGSASSSTSGTGGGSAEHRAAATATATTTTSQTTTTAPDAGLPKVGHVFLVTLSAASERDVFGASSKAPYLRRLAKAGTVLSGFHSLGTNGLADVLASVSGQPPNRDSATGCRTYVAFPQTAKVSSAGVARGRGCIYPDAVLTVADQVNAAGRTWGAYVAGMGQTNCPVPATGAALDTPLAGTEAGYDVAHDPFAFFGSLLDAGGCSQYDQDLTSLTRALARRSATPDFTYLGGDACVDAAPVLAPQATTTTTATTTPTATATTPAAPATTPAAPATTPTVTATTPTVTATTPTATATTGTGAATSPTTATGAVPSRLQTPAAYGCPPGETSGVPAEDGFLKAWVPRILASAAYRADGVLVIAFTGAGGRLRADTGALVLSRWTAHGRRLGTSYGPYSLLRSIEDMLDLQPLANAATAPAFARDVLR